MLRKTIAAIGIMVSVASMTTISAEAAWKKDNTGWWYTEGNSYATGWRNIDGKWYYFDSNGYMKTGWLSYGGKKYYLKSTGQMAVGDVYINGKIYKFNSSGQWIENEKVTNEDSAYGESHSISQVIDKWNKLKPTFTDSNIFEEEPSTKAPYKAGKLKAEYIKDCINYINFSRYLAGVGSVKLDSKLSNQAQHGAVLTTANNALVHDNPIHPNGMSNDFYELGKTATKSSNLSGGKLFQGIKSCLDDDNNLYGIENLGHRQWLLDPKVTKIGLGSTSTYSVQTLPFYDFDENVSYPEYIAWPSKGAFPNTCIGRNALWSLNLNKDIYQLNNDVKVTVTRLSDNKIWNLNKVSSFSKETTGFKILKDNPYGFGKNSHTIVFHIGNSDLPENKYLGEYKVEVSGLNKKVEYTINFFDLDNVYLNNSNSNIKEDKDSNDSVSYNNSQNNKFDKNGAGIEESNVNSSSQSSSEKKGWNKINGKWYFYSNGVKQTGFIKVNDKKYYLDDSGVMQTGWIKANGKWYYAASSGELYTSVTKTIDGVKYTFDKNGAWIEENNSNVSTNTSKNEKKKPIIKCENDPVYIYEDDDFDYALLEASAVDGYGNDISTKIQYSGHVDNTIPGSYNVNLKVTDSYGNKAEKSVCVRVKSRYDNVSNKGTKEKVSNTTETANGTINITTTVTRTISVTDMEITPNKIMCPVGSRSNKFTVNILPDDATDKSVTWKSSDTSIAKVDGDGNITAVGRGKATITCMALDGSEESVSALVEVY